MICKYCQFEGKAMKAAARGMRQCSACHKWSRVVKPAASLTLSHARHRLHAACHLLEAVFQDPPSPTLAVEIELFLVITKKELS